MQQSHNDITTWVQERILASVYVNDTESPAEIPPFRVLPQKQVTRIRPDAPPLSHPPQHLTVVDQILAIMMSSAVRRGARQLITQFIPTLRAQLTDLVGHHQPISFLLPTLPFKDQSPFATGAAIDHVDLGEYALFAQLQRIIGAIKNVYPPGAHMTLLCDGYIYADIFANGDTDGAGRYKARCEQIKNEYGLYNEVTLFDLREVLFDMPSWQEEERTMRAIVHTLYTSDASIRARLDHLARRFMYHVALPGVSYTDARALYLHDPLPNDLVDRLRAAALRYSALLLTLQKTDLVHRAFPAALRCTVHPKAATQFPLHLTNPHNQLLPYNGVATVSRGAMARGVTLFQALRIRRLCDVLREDDVVVVHTDNSRDPFYYDLP